MNYSFQNKFLSLFFAVFDFFGYLLFLPFNILNHKLPKNITNILIIRLDHIGDIIYSTVVLENIKNTYPQAKITFLTSGAGKEIIENNPNVDNLIIFNAPWFNRKEKKIFVLGDFFKLVDELKEYNFDLGFDLRGDFRHILLMLLSGVKLRIGFGITGGGFLLNKKVSYKKNLHPIEHNLDLLRSININVITYIPRIFIKKEAETQIYKLLKYYDFKEGDFTVIIHSQAGNPSKNWPKEKFAELLNQIYKKYKARIILTGSQDDRLANAEIINLSRVQALNLSGEINLQELFALINQSNLFVGIDSGPSHIASLTKKPVIILYSGTNISREWAPKSSNVVIIQKKPACGNCNKTTCSDNICMDLITVEEVIKAVEGVIK